MKSAVMVLALMVSAPAFAFWVTLFSAGSYIDQRGNTICVYEGMGQKVSLSMYGLCPLQIQYNSQTGEIRK